MNTIEIVSNGSPFETTVRTKSGCVIDGISSIEIHPIVPGESVKATIVFDLVTLGTNGLEYGPPSNGISMFES
jgi:hypothetical protein